MLPLGGRYGRMLANDALLRTGCDRVSSAATLPFTDAGELLALPAGAGGLAFRAKLAVRGEKGAFPALRGGASLSDCRVVPCALLGESSAACPFLTGEEGLAMLKVGLLEDLLDAWSASGSMDDRTTAGEEGVLRPDVREGDLTALCVLDLVGERRPPRRAPTGFAPVWDAGAMFSCSSSEPYRCVCKTRSTSSSDSSSYSSQS